MEQTEKNTTNNLQFVSALLSPLFGVYFTFLLGLVTTFFLFLKLLLGIYRLFSTR